MILLDDIPNLITIDKFPDYYDWYAIDRGDCIEVIQTSSELSFSVNYGYAQSDNEYYWIGKLKYSRKGEILSRSMAYDIVKKYYDTEYKSFFWNDGIKLARIKVTKSLVTQKEL